MGEGVPADKVIELLSSVSGDDYKENLGGYVGIPLVVLISAGESNDRAVFKSVVESFRASRAGNLFIQTAVGIAGRTGTENVFAFEEDIF